MTRSKHRHTLPKLAAGGAGLALTLAACGGAPTGTTGATASGGTSPASGSAPGPGVTFQAAQVSGVGTVLVNAHDGRTLYLLTSERGGKLTCTDANGCTKVWPDTELPSGVTAATAGNGVRASLLGTVRSADGHLYPTYAGWPLYEYSGDPGSGRANGEGITSFGGTWYALSPAGTPVTSSTGSSGATTATRAGY